MRNTKYVLFAALGVAALLLLTSDRAKELRDELEETALDNAKKLKNKLSKLGSKTSDTLSDLREMLGSEMEGLSDDARERIEGILNKGSKVKKAVSKQMS
jgi:gas vesicle protein